MKGKSVLILGCGDIGIRLGLKLIEDGVRVIGVRRDPSKLPDSFEKLSADFSEPGSLAAVERLAPDYIVTTLTPSGRDEAGYQRGYVDAADNLVRGLGAHRPQHLFVVSSSRVYAERDGGWVTDDSPVAASGYAASALLGSEEILASIGCPYSLLRCAGIYGAPGGRLLRKVAAGNVAPAEPVAYTNRVHRNDVAGFIHYLIEDSNSGASLHREYLVVDDVPSPRHEVEQWMARKLGLSVIEQTKSDERPVHKRCRNDRLKDSGYRLLYPNYKAGYATLINS